MQLFTSMLPSNQRSDTPVQQTRSGRISRPPINPPPRPLLQTLATADQSATAIRTPLEDSAPQVGVTPNYEALYQAMNDGVAGNAGQLGQADGGFWRGGDDPIAASSWIGHTPTPEETLAKWRKRKREVSDTEEDSGSGLEDDTPGRYGVDAGSGLPLPAWPLPPSGPKSRKNMPRDELLARRRARNRVAGE